jgi:hypothetical protein
MYSLLKMSYSLVQSIISLMAAPFVGFTYGENNSPLGVTPATGIRFPHVKP